MTKKERNWNIAAIYFVAVLQMGGAGMSPIMKELSNAFPQYSVTAIQFVMTGTSITVILTNLITGWLCEHFPKKYIVAAGCALGVLFALLGCLFNSSLILIYVWSGILGIATSLSCTVSTAIVNDMFEPEERVSIFGVRACVSSIGTMLMTFVGGYLVSANWRYGFLVYLIILPGLILTLAVHPRNTKLAESSEATSHTEFNKKALIFPCLTALFVSMLYSVSMVNSSMLVAESGFVDASVSATRGGMLSTAFLLVGGIVGLGLNKLSSKIGLHTMTVGFASIVIGYLIIFFAKSYSYYIAAAVICGGAITLTMPHLQILGSDAGGKRHELGLSIVILFANLGSLISPVITILSKLIFKTENVRYRYLLAAILSAAVCAYVSVQIERLKVGKESERG